MKILVIEDQAIEMKLVHLVLSAAGHSVTSAGAAELAFEVIRSDRPAIILLDMTLPGMDGLELVRMLKADPATRDIQVVGVTSNLEKFGKEGALHAGCDAFIIKPLSTRTLPQTLTDVVAMGRSAS